MATTELSEATSSLERIQRYDTSEFDRAATLGSTLNMDEAIQPAHKLIDLFGLIPASSLSEFPSRQLQQIRTQADQVHVVLNKAVDFTSDQDNPSNVRKQIINEITEQYDAVFQALFPLISFASARATDFQRLEREGRAAVQSIEDRTSELYAGLESTQAEAQQILDDVRKTALEQGVSQQAIYFREESDAHSADAKHWRSQVYIWGGALITYSIASFAIHKIPFLAPGTSYEAIQLVTSKLLLFGVLAYMLFLSARNFLSHKHNAVTNKHRQNSLVTFKALADAGGTLESRDVVLRYAAASVFMPQDTGYIRSSQGGMPGAATLVELTSQSAESAS